MSSSSSPSHRPLFGGPAPWLPTHWRPVNDTLRGGSSTSSLLSASPSSSAAHHPAPHTAVFAGILDTKTLGGAGFASQAYTPPRRRAGEKDREAGGWDLSAYDGVEIRVGRGDGKVYTLILKDEVVPAEEIPRGERAGVNWEVEFRACDRVGEDGENEKEREQVVWCPWVDFKPTYRGREKKDAGRLKTGEIRQMSIMMRSFFGTQEGKFEVELNSISAVKYQSKKEDAKAAFVNTRDHLANAIKNVEGGKGAERDSTSWFSWLPSHCVVS